MKYLILFFVSFNLLTNIVFSQNIQWMSLDEARAAQKVNPKKFLWMFIQVGVGLVSY